MNMTVLVIILVSIGFLGIGTFILNNKYIKNADLEDDFVAREIKAMKISGTVNILNGCIGRIISILCLIIAKWTKELLIIFVVCIVILTSIQYILNKSVRK